MGSFEIKGVNKGKGERKREGGRDKDREMKEVKGEVEEREVGTVSPFKETGYYCLPSMQV